MLTVRVSEKGQVVLPKQLRERLGVRRGHLLEVAEYDGGILLRPLTADRDAAPRSWRRWRGVLKNTDALRDLEQEHSREVRGGR